MLTIINLWITGCFKYCLEINKMLFRNKYKIEGGGDIKATDLKRIRTTHSLGWILSTISVGGRAGEGIFWEAVAVSWQEEFSNNTQEKSL